MSNMAKLIERVGKQTLIDGEPIDLGNLVSAGAEILIERVKYGYGTKADGSRERARNEALDEMRKRALRLAEEYCCSYVMMGGNISEIEDYESQAVNHQLIVSFFNDKKIINIPFSILVSKIETFKYRFCFSY